MRIKIVLGQRWQFTRRDIRRETRRPSGFSSNVPRFFTSVTPAGKGLSVAETASRGFKAERIAYRVS